MEKLCEIDEEIRLKKDMESRTIDDLFLARSVRQYYFRFQKIKQIFIEKITERISWEEFYLKCLNDEILELNSKKMEILQFPKSPKIYSKEWTKEQWVRSKVRGTIHSDETITRLSDSDGSLPVGKF